MSMLDGNWFARCEDAIPQFLRRLKIGDQPGRYAPCQRGATLVGREMALAWSCFALKTLHTLGRWETSSREQREEWVDFIQDFQRSDEEGAFEDPPEMAHLRKSPGLVASLLGLIGRGPWRPEPRSILLAETKQAIATLAEVNETPVRPFRGFPITPAGVREWLDRLDWSKPWGAGGQSAGLAVFIVTEAPRFLAERDATELRETCRAFFDNLADPETGAYFRGTPPAHGELVNGAMKVLMALDWLDVPIHYPEKLVATTLAAPPKSDGCHLVDAIYVLHRALAKNGADAKARAYCLETFEALRRHEHDEGGFSFYERRAQTNYYGVPISRGLDEPDIQGTCLLAWAAAMIWQLVEPGSARWAVLKP
jgi:hypothetical protein